MTKKIFFAALAFLLFTSVTAFAQANKETDRPHLLQVYEDWKQKEMAGRTEMPEHIALVVISQRTGVDSAQLDFAAIGTMGNELTLEIQPMMVIRNNNGQAIGSQPIGKATLTNVLSHDANVGLNSPVTISVHVPADQRADAVMVKWVISKPAADGGDRWKQTLSDTTVHLLLEKSPQSNLTAIVKARPGNSPGKSN